MKQNVHIIGQLMEVKPTEYENKKTKEIHRNTELTIMSDTYDDDGYKRITVDTVRADEEYFDDFVDHKGKFIAVPYLYTNDDFGSSFRYDRSMPIIELQKNPFEAHDKQITKPQVQSEKKQ